MNPSPRSRLFFFIVGLALTGCVVMRDEKRTISGADIKAETFAQVTPGQKWTAVLELLGEPTEVVKEDGGAERWRWHFSETSLRQNAFLLIRLGKSETKIEHTYLVEFKDGIVTKVWTE